VLTCADRNEEFDLADTRTYTVILEPAEEGGFVVHVPALPEVVTEGDSEAEALAMAKEAIELALELRIAEGEEIPQEREPQMRQVTVSVVEPSAA
jgi:antitoxin HicB